MRTYNSPCNLSFWRIAIVAARNAVSECAFDSESVEARYAGLKTKRRGLYSLALLLSMPVNFFILSMIATCGELEDMCQKGIIYTTDRRQHVLVGGGRSLEWSFVNRTAAAGDCGQKSEMKLRGGVTGGGEMAEPLEGFSGC